MLVLMDSFKLVLTSVIALNVKEDKSLTSVDTLVISVVKSATSRANSVEVYPDKSTTS